VGICDQQFYMDVLLKYLHNADVPGVCDRDFARLQGDRGKGRDRDHWVSVGQARVDVETIQGFPRPNHCCASDYADGVGLLIFAFFRQRYGPRHQ